VTREDDQVRLGAATASVDALGYHAWAASASWPVARSAELASVAPGGQPDVVLAYAYDRWRPAIYVQFEDETTPLLVAQTGSDEREPVSVRDRSVTLGATLPWRRVRWSQTLFAAWRLEHRAVEGGADRATAQQGALRAGWALATAKRFGYSISPERGVRTGIAFESARRAFGSDADTSLLHVDFRAFVPGWPRHAVLAMRASGTSARGSTRGLRAPRLGGAAGDVDLLGLDADASSLLRGFPSNAFVGRHVALLNAEYRLPLGWPQRGVSTWPIFLRSLHGTVFGDVGHAWDGGFHLEDAKRAWGGELSADIVAGFVVPLTLTVGAGWGRDGAGVFPNNREVYVRLGHGF
jgi:hypothetical protein